MAHETPWRPPHFMANIILNFHFDHPHTSLIRVINGKLLDCMFCCIVVFIIIKYHHYHPPPWLSQEASSHVSDSATAPELVCQFYVNTTPPFPFMARPELSIYCLVQFLLKCKCTETLPPPPQDMIKNPPMLITM